MRLLLDTNIVIRSMANTKLSSAGRTAIAGASEVVVSAAAIWEIAIKSGLGQLNVDLDRLLARLAEAGAQRLPITWEHARAVRELPLLHRDPFDRLMVAQAEVEGLRFLTTDAFLAGYGSLVEVV